MKTIQSIDKAVFILELISKNNGKLTLTDISNILDIKITTLHGLIGTLEYRNMVSKNLVTGKYQLGVKLFEFGKVYESNISIIEKVHPFLVEIENEFNETVHLAVPFENRILYIDKVETSHFFRLTSMVGTTEKAIDSAIGMVIIANLDQRKYDDFVGNFDNINSNEEADFANEDIVDDIRKNGYYIKFEEKYDFYCIAVPLINLNSNVVGAISVVVPNFRYNEQLSLQIVNKLKKISDNIKYCL